MFQTISPELHFSHDEFRRRKALLQKAMQKAELDAVLLFNPASQYWLTGYDTFGYCFFQCLIVLEDGRIALLTRSADFRQAQLTSLVEDIRVWKDEPKAIPALDLKALLTELAPKCTRIGVEWETHGLTVNHGRALEGVFKEDFHLRDASMMVTRLRLIKSAEELACVEKAAGICNAALDAAIATTKAGADEADILAAMHQTSFAMGGDYPGNPFIIGSGQSALLCRYKSGRRVLDREDQLTLEWAGVWRHYHCSAMRTLITGTPSAHHLKLHEAGAEALLACEEKLKPGSTFGDVFEAHASTLDRHGLNDHKLNACGYSLGAVFAPSWMDWPMFYQGNEEVIEEGMVLFLHMIIMDSDEGKAMCLGRTSIIGEYGPNVLDSHALEPILC